MTVWTRLLGKVGFNVDFVTESMTNRLDLVESVFKKLNDREGKIKTTITYVS